jgi:hypothetical protein
MREGGKKKGPRPRTRPKFREETPKKTQHAPQSGVGHAANRNMRPAAGAFKDFLQVLTERMAARIQFLVDA